MVQPVVEPTDREAVKAQLQLVDTRLDGVVDGVVAAVCSFVRTLPVAQVDGDAWPAHVALGSTMLAARLVKRRDTPSGVAVFGDNAAFYVQRNDPDVALLLQLGAYGKPAVG